MPFYRVGRDASGNSAVIDDNGRTFAVCPNDDGDQNDARSITRLQNSMLDAQALAQLVQRAAGSVSDAALREQLSDLSRKLLSLS